MNPGIIFLERKPTQRSQPGTQTKLGGRQTPSVLSAALLLLLLAAFLVPADKAGDQLAHGALLNINDGDFVTPVLTSGESVHLLNEHMDGVVNFAGYDLYSTVLVTPEGKKVLRAGRVAGKLLEFFGGELLVGSFSGAPKTPYVFISEILWQELFERDSEVVGRTFFVEQQDFVVAGVIRFTQGPWAEVDLWIPIMRYSPIWEVACLRLVARLEQDLSPKRLEKSIERTIRHLSSDSFWFGGNKIRVVGVDSGFVLNLLATTCGSPGETFPITVRATKPLVFWES